MHNYWLRHGFVIMVYGFQAKVAAGGNDVYKNTSWEEAKTEDKVLIELGTDGKSKEIDPYCCLIKEMVYSNN